MLNRAVLFLALIGMVVALHLWVQKERNFDRGCWGLGTAGASAPAGGCQDPKLQQASYLFGVSAATWGYLFFAVIAALAFAKIGLPPVAARRCHDFSEIAVACALPYTIYLVIFQTFVAHAFCPLCLVSSTLVLLLLVVHVLIWKRGGFVPIAEPDRVQEIGYASVLTFGGATALIAVLVFVDQIATRRIEPGAFAGAAGGRPDAAHRVPPTLDIQQWTGPETPALGTSRQVVVATFFDPNCPHCESVYSTILNLADHYKNTATFYIFPRILWDYSILQVQGLEVAKQQGKYFEMWRLQFAHQRRGGLKEEDLKALFADLGIKTDDLSTRLAAVRTGVLELREKARLAGINSTPTIFINGVWVNDENRSWDGLARLIERASEQYQPETVDSAAPAKGAGNPNVK